jgi:YesN/AraC family two-component response regulator
VSIQDCCGLFNDDIFAIPVEKRVHSTHFCSIAKTTARGFRYCYYCKKLSVKKCTEDKSPFWGRCPFGVLEYSYPVVYNEKVLAIIFAGNICDDINNVKTEIEKRKFFSDIELSSFEKEFKNFEYNPKLSEIERKVKALGDYITLLAAYSMPSTIEKRHQHPIIPRIIDFAITNYEKDLTIEGLAKLFSFNAKYIGRVFKKEVGTSFANYITQMRVTSAENMLRKTYYKIVDIAEKCGFQNVSYFNRVFKTRLGVTPSEYRTQCLPKNN